MENNIDIGYIPVIIGSTSYYKTIIGSTYTTEAEAIKWIISTVVEKDYIVDDNGESFYEDSTVEVETEKIYIMVKDLKSLKSFCKRYGDSQYERKWNVDVKNIAKS